MNNVSSSFLTGAKSGIGGVGAKIVNTTFKCDRGMQLYAPVTNSGTIWVGASEGITINTGNATDGFPLASGESILLPIRDPNLVFVKSNVGGLIVNWMLF